MQGHGGLGEDHVLLIRDPSSTCSRHVKCQDSGAVWQLS